MRLILLVFCVLTIFSLSSFKRTIPSDNISSNHLDTVNKDTVKNDTLDIDTVSIGITVAQKYEARKRQYRTAYMWGDNKKPLKINPLGGIAVNINKLYSHFSKKGKNSRRVMRLFEDEFTIDSTNVLWKPLTVKLTNLKGDSLFYFQMYFLPKPGFLENSTYYEKVEYVVKSMRIYRDSVAVIHESMKLPKWQPAEK